MTSNIASHIRNIMRDFGENVIIVTLKLHYRKQQMKYMQASQAVTSPTDQALSNVNILLS